MATTIAKTEQWYTPAEAAVRMGLSVNSVRRLYKSGQLSHTQVLRLIRIYESDIVEYLERNHHCAAVPAQRHRRERKAS